MVQWYEDSADDIDEDDDDEDVDDDTDEDDDDVIPIISMMIGGSRLEQHPMRATECGTVFARLPRMRPA